MNKEKEAIQLLSEWVNENEDRRSVFFLTAEQNEDGSVTAQLVYQGKTAVTCAALESAIEDGDNALKLVFAAMMRNIIKSGTKQVLGTAYDIFETSLREEEGESHE